MSVHQDYTTVEEILERLYSKIDYDQEVDFGMFLEWVADALDIIGTIPMYQECQIELEIENYRAKLPCNMIQIHSVYDKRRGEPLIASTGAFHPPLHIEPDTTVSDSNNFKAFTPFYAVKAGYIYPGYNEGEVIINYYSIPTDDHGYPLIPNDTKVKNAIVSYVAYKIGYRMYFKQTLPQVLFLQLEKDWCFDREIARHESIIPQSIDEWESWKNQVLKLIPEVNHHYTGLSGLARPEQRYNNNRGSRYSNNNFSNLTDY